MTLSQFWKIRVGVRLYDSMYKRSLIVIKREICIDKIGFSYTKKSTPIREFRYVQLSCKCDNGYTYFYDSTNPDFVRTLNFI